MAAESSIVMQEISLRKSLPSWERHLTHAIENQFGRDIELIDFEDLDGQLKQFISDLVFKVDHCSPEPLVKQPCVIDITHKKFFNLGETETIESIIRAGKNSTIAIGTKYHFLCKEGVCFDHKVNLGAQIVSISMSGGEMRVGENIFIKDQAYNQGLMFYYSHEEKLFIPPKKKVTATVTTFTKKFEQSYTLQFKIERSKRIKIAYLTKRQQRCWWFISKHCCCSYCRPSIGYVYAGELLQALPNFNMDDNYCYFTLDGTLTWIGEECSVQMDQSDI